MFFSTAETKGKEACDESSTADENFTTTRVLSGKEITCEQLVLKQQVMFDICRDAVLDNAYEDLVLLLVVASSGMWTTVSKLLADLGFPVLVNRKDKLMIQRGRYMKTILVYNYNATGASPLRGIGDPHILIFMMEANNEPDMPMELYQLALMNIERKRPIYSIRTFASKPVCFGGDIYKTALAFEQRETVRARTTVKLTNL